MFVSYTLGTNLFPEAKPNVSGYVCNHGSPSGERDTASPRGHYGERLQRDSCLKKHMKKTPSVGRRQPMTSLPARPQYKDGRANTSSASSSEACVRSMAPKPRGRSVSFPTRGTMVTYVTWDVPLHGNFELRPLGATMGNVIPTPPCWGECKPNSRRRRAQVNSTIWLRELPLFGRLMLSVTLSSFGLKPELHTWSTYLLGAGITGPKVELTGLESFLYRKIPLRG